MSERLRNEIVEAKLIAWADGQAILVRYASGYQEVVELPPLAVGCKPAAARRPRLTLVK